jgi:hypothetical protein
MLLIDGMLSNLEIVPNRVTVFDEENNVGLFREVGQGVNPKPVLSCRPTHSFKIVEGVVPGISSQRRCGQKVNGGHWSVGLGSMS